MWHKKILADRQALFSLTNTAYLLVVCPLLHQLVVDHLLEQLTLHLQTLYLHLVGRCEVVSFCVMARPATKVGCDGLRKLVAFQLVVRVTIALQIAVYNLMVERECSNCDGF